MSEKGTYRTKQGDALKEYIKTLPGQHFTVHELCEHCMKSGIKVGQTTVYRQLEKLVSEGSVKKYTIDGTSAACFEYTPNGEQTVSDCFHCKCEKCGKLIHLHCEEVSAIQSHLKEHHGFLLNPTRTVFYGICKTCQKES